MAPPQLIQPNPTSTFNATFIKWCAHNLYAITDLGLSKPANEKSNKKVYGILLYVAPEDSRGKIYIQESDIYGIIIYETRFNIKVPHLIMVDTFKQCVEADPLKRPTAKYLLNELN
ncbi:hypothetical protein C1645_837133 [Glomus cerebriforme]|uniref:Protein kinase domain-containing protein n=1 Tax=Glomus cerebriforme TaxID=658196 RepID=A0A397S5U1_9GLOM|nr:hypothetical protein C1645_837133 [Glomus cerebriforme]